MHVILEQLTVVLLAWLLTANGCKPYGQELPVPPPPDGRVDAGEVATPPCQFALSPSERTRQNNECDNLTVIRTAESGCGIRACQSPSIAVSASAKHISACGCTRQ